MEREKPWHKLYRYWLDKHVEGRAPARGDLDPPLEIPALVGRLMLVEPVAGDFFYRLVGSDIARYLAIEVTGRKVGDNGWAPEPVRSEWHRMIGAVVGSQRPHMAITLPAPGNGRTGLCLALPLVDRAGATEQVLICIFPGRNDSGSKALEGIEIFEFEP